MSATPKDKCCTAVAVRSFFCARTAANSRSVGSADTSLRRAVVARLIAEPLLVTGHIEVAVIAGRVTLSGYVTSHAQKGAASVAVRRIEGVLEVADEVSVAVPYPAGSGPPAEDLETRPPISAPR
jgi:osmotically-inducible protein OsmY